MEKSKKSEAELRAAGREIRRIAAPTLEQLDRDLAGLTADSLRTFAEASAEEQAKADAEAKKEE